jgi:Raf kinase inhibitor-like YbhB/YbcL family protein
MTAVVLFAALSIASPAFQQNGSIPSAFTCDGAGKNPALEIGGTPAAAKSLALIVFDPDVPKAIKSDGRYLHWALWNLAPTSAVIEEGRGGGLSEGGRSGWIPPCPPNGEHRYVFQAFALDASLGDAKIASEADLRRVMQGHVLEQAELVGRYTGRVPSLLGSILLGLVLLVAVVILYRVIRRGRAAEPAS